MAKRLIKAAIQGCDEYVLTLDYTDAKGERTRRVVSPIRFLGADRFLALCLSRCEPRQFHLDRCSNMNLRRAEEYVMPVPLSADL